MEAFRATPTFSKILTQSRIVTTALATGMLSFAAVIGYLTYTNVAPILNGNNVDQLRLPLALGAAGLTLVQGVAAYVVGSAMDSQLVRRLREQLSGSSDARATDPTRILSGDRLQTALMQWQSGRIVRMALFEAAGIFSLMMTLMTGSPIAAGAALVAWFGVVLHYPTESGLLGWLERIALRMRDTF